MSAPINATGLATEAAITALRIAQHQSQQPNDQPQATDQAAAQTTTSTVNNIWNGIKTSVLNFTKNAAIDYPKITLLITAIMAYSAIVNAGVINLTIAGLGIVTIVISKDEYWKAFSFYVKKKSEFVWNREEKINNRIEIEKSKGLTIGDITKLSWEYILTSTKNHPEIVSISAVALLFIGIIKASIICYAAAIIATVACVFERNAVIEAYHGYFSNKNEKKPPKKPNETKV